MFLGISLVKIPVENALGVSKIRTGRRIQTLIANHRIEVERDTFHLDALSILQHF